ncbi:MAG: hypothetical protein A2014_08780 [Spirochaetes bacterium GWF1_49_6]|jgi:hypothetical protein|nr:MAG: hypothetical protein A2014_08780 [Spirochaetes bacterium GWF1_49_6]
MIITEEFTDEKEIMKVIALFCGNQTTAKFSDRDIVFNARFKEIRSGQIILSQVDSSHPGLSLEDYNMRPLDAEVVLGGSIYIFEAIPMGAKNISMPNIIKAHPKRKNERIKISGNEFVQKMFATISMKVVDFTVQDEELAKKIHLIIATIESHLTRSENYDIAKISLFDGTEKNIITRLIKKLKKPFVVFNTANFKIKEDLVLSYEDYVKFLSEEGFDLKNILSQLDKVKEFYQKNVIKSEAILPLIFEGEAIGQIRVVSLKEYITKTHVRRLITLAQQAVENLFEKCSFEIVTKEPQILQDMSVGGAKITITEPDMYKYIRELRRIYMQLTFPDATQIKTMGTILNMYDNTPEGYRVIGIKFSANIDWRDKSKLDEFIQSVMRLQNVRVSN